jgi:endonuclease YncB( thermonuclease family)
VPKQFTGDLAFGQVVTVRVRDIDGYKRRVAEIIRPDGRNLNQEIVRAGWCGGIGNTGNRIRCRPLWEKRRGTRSEGCGGCIVGAAMGVPEGGSGGVPVVVQ